MLAILVWYFQNLVNEAPRFFDKYMNLLENKTSWIYVLYKLFLKLYRHTFLEIGTVETFLVLTYLFPEARSIRIFFLHLTDKK